MWGFSAEDRGALGSRLRTERGAPGRDWDPDSQSGALAGCGLGGDLGTVTAPRAAASPSLGSPFPGFPVGSWVRLRCTLEPLRGPSECLHGGSGSKPGAWKTKFALLEGTDTKDSYCDSAFVI